MKTQLGLWDKMEFLQVLEHRLQLVSGHNGLHSYRQIFFRANPVGTLVEEGKYRHKYYEDNMQFFWLSLMGYKYSSPPLLHKRFYV